MKASVIQSIPLPGIPSASGMEILDGTIFIIGDDTPFLFVLNKNYDLVRRIRLFDAEMDAHGKIPKSTKPDLEALTIVSYHKKKFLLVLGSGSIRETRDVGFLVGLKDESVKRISLTLLYDRIREALKEWDAGDLNIEGAAYRKGWLHLFQRGNITNKNIIITLSWKDFIRYPETGSSSSFRAHQINLPDLSGISAGFSGACLIPDSNDLLFTASVENTPNTIDDGPSFGSFVGKLTYSTYPEKNPATARVAFGDNFFAGKIESIAVLKKYSDNDLEALAVCDDDNLSSELLRIRITD